MIRPVFCFDLDGTLVDGFGRIHSTDISLLSNRESAFSFIVCTGRSLESVRKTFARNGMFINRKIPFPLVLLNGSLIINQNEEFLAFFPFSGDIQREIILRAKHHNAITFLFLSRFHTYVLGKNPFGARQIEKYEFSPSRLDKWNSENPFSKVMCISEDRDALLSFQESIASIQVERDYSMPAILELTPVHVNKGYGLRQLLPQNNNEKNAVFAAGDGENDLSMAAVAEEFFVPANAPREIKARATRIIEQAREGLLTPMIDRWIERYGNSPPRI